MNLAQALRLPRPSLRDTSSISEDRNQGGGERVAFVGSGGKSTAIFALARELPQPVIVTATTHLHVNQICLASSHWAGTTPEELTGFEDHLQGVILVTGPIEGDHTTGVSESLLDWLHDFHFSRHLPLLIEADGSRQRPLKAPAEHEPVIPDFVDTVIAVAGMSGLGKALTAKHVHRPEIFARLSGLRTGETISPEAVVRVLTHPAGGLKNIPPAAHRVLLLNQANTPELQSTGGKMAQDLLAAFETVLVGTLEPENVQTFERTAGIILAAGEARRYGQPKQLLDWHGKPFVRQAAETALAAGLSPVVVVTGANAEQVEATLQGLPTTISHNPHWKNGQSTSIQTGLQALPLEAKAAIFLLADQPQVTQTVLRALVERHRLDLSPIVAPQVQGQRANPVLFDRVAFPDLLSLSGDVGGRAIFSKFPVTYVPWHDESLLADIDTPEDYRRLTGA